MGFEIKEIFQPDIKSQTCNDILRSIPKWFGNEEAIIDYANITQDMPFYAAYDEGKAVGFAAIKIHNSFTAEVCVMGVKERYHRQGIGAQLIGVCEEYCTANNKMVLTVKTLDVSANYEPYERTRSFYSKMGFVPLEVFPLYWDKDNPCLFLAKYLGKGKVTRAYRNLRFVLYIHTGIFLTFVYCLLTVIFHTTIVSSFG